MRKISITDITLRVAGEAGTLNFKEKVEVAKCLDRLNVSAMELAPLGEGKTDAIFVKTLAGVIKNATIAQPVGLTEESVEAAWDALKGAVRPRLVVDVPVSSVQMEFIARKKPAAMLEINVIGKTVLDAIPEIEAFLDSAVLANLDEVRIVHGMGTGKLRAGIHEYLRKERHVAEFRLGRYGEGDTGVTIVTLK